MLHSMLWPCPARPAALDMASSSTTSGALNLWLQPPADELKVFCNTLRAKHGVEWREGILHDKRVEFFRGKDLQRYYQKHPSNFEKWVGGPGEAAVLGQS